jgi:hypothetical protein
MQGKGKGNISLSLSSEKYDKVILVPQETDGVPIFNEVKLNSTNCMQLMVIRSIRCCDVSTIHQLKEMLLKSN